jgi:DNA-binding NarL/FixJ family response regulator
VLWRIRILLVELPRILRDIISDVVAQERDMEVVRVLETRDALLTAVQESPADVVILGLADTALPEVCDELVGAHPQMKVLAVAGDGRGVFLHELRPQTLSLGEVSPQGLIDAVRAAATA